MTKTKRFFLSTGVVIGIIILALFASNQISFGAPLVSVSTFSTSTSASDYSLTIGTSSPVSVYGSTTLAVYGSTTIQTWLNTTHAFRIINAASTTVFEVDTVNASTTVAGQLNAQTLTVGSCTGCGGTFPFTPTANGNSTSTTIIFGQGFISQASSTISSGVVRIDGTLGIGTAPSYPLHLVDSTGDQAALFDTPGTNNIFIGTRNTGNGTVIGTENSVGGSIYTGTSPYAALVASDGAFPIEFLTGDSLKMRISPTGSTTIVGLLNVGNITTTSSASSTFQDISFVDAQGTSLSLSGGLSVTGAATLAGGSTITCTSCITDANVVDAITLPNLTATDGTLTFSGTYNGTTARTIGLNLGNANTWTALQIFNAAASGASSTWGALNFGTGIATSTLDLSGTPTFKVPVSASSTITASGELEIDTSKNAIHFNSGGTTYAIHATGSVTFVIASSTTGMESAFIVAPFNLTVRRVWSMNSVLTGLGTTSLSTTTGHDFQVWHGTRGAPIALFTTTKNTVSTSTFTEHTATFNDNSILLNNLIWVKDHNASSSLHDMVIQVEYTRDP